MPGGCRAVDLKAASERERGHLPQLRSSVLGVEVYTRVHTPRAPGRPRKRRGFGLWRVRCCRCADQLLNRGHRGRREKPDVRDRFSQLITLRRRRTVWFLTTEGGPSRRSTASPSAAPDQEAAAI